MVTYSVKVFNLAKLRRAFVITLASALALESHLKFTSKFFF